VGDSHPRRTLFNYLSFATMATPLGYGDITQVARLGNTLAWLEVLTAQFYYLAVVIAQLVWLKLAKAVSLGGSDRK